MLLLLLSASLEKNKLPNKGRTKMRLALGSNAQVNFKLIGRLGILKIMILNNLYNYQLEISNINSWIWIVVYRFMIISSSSSLHSAQVSCIEISYS